MSEPRSWQHAQLDKAIALTLERLQKEPSISASIPAVRPQGNRCISASGN